ncbi:glucosylglycerate synthase [Desulfatibacillum alkenivorans DSM 16219]|jgi:glycosyltransferase involved in cell wall biosynthesis|uniref:Glucosylglycerate synthase n=1 Tax=Desulfatibacillum alkenivorans DSM 16219 TaxID=1121393 RepID=A0A1M6GEC8_9BACT|nr:glycosyltransferase [Desulfatibacillum alkenivorans]SHJ08292.1 glucosylglycerate synthase [Desulfatibacillum alkenivorans DSM 16219]
MRYNTGLRAYTSKRVEEIEKADILVGIPCYNNQETIAHVIQMVSHGLFKHYKEQKSVIMIADGGSTDDTRESAKEFEIKPWQEKIVSIYRGPGGKGSAFRSIFEAASRLQVRTCMVVDSDLRSITSDWVKYLLEPVLEKDYQYVCPIYSRYKYDGTITNNIVYNLTRALYGLRIRQPIGGDFAFSGALANYYMDQDVWASDVARYGIDIWMTTNAVTNNFKICQANLGVKVHDAKDPSESLGPMFKQVIYTLFRLMEEYEDEWKSIQGSRTVPVFGLEEFLEPEPIAVNLKRLVQEYRMGFRRFKSLYQEIFCPECYEELKKCSTMSPTKFRMPVKTWVRVLYETAAAFHHWDANRDQLVGLVTPLYLGRVASFINQTKKMNSSQAEQVVEEQAAMFEEEKGYLLEVWDAKPKNG